jgi:hypothetical protein
MSKFAEKDYKGLYKMGLTNPVSGYIMPKPYYEGLTIFPICGIRGIGRFGDRWFGRCGITAPSIKALSTPLSSTTLHF